MTPEFIDTLWKHNPDALVAFAPDGMVLYWNPAAEAIFGYQRKEAIGQSVFTLIVPPDQVEAESRLLAEALARGLVVAEYSRKRRDGSLFHANCSTTVVRDGQQRLACFLATARDVTHLRAPQDVQRLADMSHELRTPLNAIIGFTGTLLMKLPGPLNAEQEKQMQIVQTGARQLLALINQLLDREAAAADPAQGVPDRGS